MNAQAIATIIVSLRIISYMMIVTKFIDIICPEHDRTTCSDTNVCNGFYSRNGGDDWHGRCTRCMYLELAENIVPKGFDHTEATG